MKKILFALAIALMAAVSCGKQNSELEKTYTFTDDIGTYDVVTAAHKDNCIVSFILSEYKGKWKIQENRIDNPPKGKLYNFIASKDAEYVTVHIHIVYRGEPDDGYMPERFYLSGGKTTEIVYRIRAGIGTTGNVKEEPVID